MRHVLAVAVSLCAALAAATAADPPPEKTGLKVGEKAPNFTLKDQSGKEHALKDLIKDGPVALVFYRSAKWWPFCQKQLVQLQKDLKKVETAGVRVVGVSYDSIEVLKAFADRQKITFPLLSDPDSKVITAYALRNKEAASSKIDGVPYPGTVIVGRDGVVAAKLFEDGYRERHSTDELVKAAEGLKKE